MNFVCVYWMLMHNDVMRLNSFWYKMVPFFTLEIFFILAQLQRHRACRIICWRLSGSGLAWPGWERLAACCSHRSCRSGWKFNRFSKYSKKLPKICPIKLSKSQKYPLNFLPGCRRLSWVPGLPAAGQWGSYLVGSRDCRSSDTLAIRGCFGFGPDSGRWLAGYLISFMSVFKFLSL